MDRHVERLEAFRRLDDLFKTSRQAEPPLLCLPVDLGRGRVTDGGELPQDGQELAVLVQIMLPLLQCG